jgi:Family of unknown function (DUF6516)
MQTDFGIETLLELNGNIIQQEHGYWVEIHTWRVEPSSLIPHGVRYALTLHQKNGARILGYDNAHSVIPSGKFKFASQMLPYDHKHRNIFDKGVLYEFKDAYQLLQDFFSDVDRIVQEYTK